MKGPPTFSSALLVLFSGSLNLPSLKGARAASTCARNSRTYKARANRDRKGSRIFPWWRGPRPLYYDGLCLVQSARNGSWVAKCLAKQDRPLNKLQKTQEE